MRKLALVMALTAAGLPNWASALGLGDIDLNSYLNQPLEAEIPLRTADQEELDSVHVNLASRADFARAGIDYQNSLRHLNFQVVRNHGKPVIKVTSDGDFREPYVSFLLEVNWSRGRIVREYTLLVDPPVLAGEGGAVIQAPQAAQAQQPPPAEAPAARSVASESHGMPAARRSGDTYGPTQPADTMWSIATEVRPDESVSVEQTMLALQRLNPNAFINDNVNELKAGYVLKVPDRKEIEALTRTQARAEFLRQTRVWRSGAAPAVAANEAEAAPAQAAAQGRLQLLAPDGGQDTADRAAAQQAGQGVGTGEPQAGAADGTAAGTSEQTAELRARVQQLQQQVQDMERLAQLKDDQLAALQAQLKALQAGTEPQATTADTMAEPAQPEGAAEAASAPERAAVQPDAEQSDAAVSGESEQPAATEPGAEQSPYGPPVEAVRAGADQARNPYAVEGFKPVDLGSLPKEAAREPFRNGAATPAPAPEPAKAPQPQSITDRIDAWWQNALATFRDNPLYMGIAAAVLIVLLLALMLVRQRRRAAAGFGESILQPPPATERVPAAAAAAAAAPMAAEEQQTGAASAEPESSYLSDFSISGLDSAIESEISEADPLTEADVFLAYGRFQPAENMIKEAIENEPERLDLKIKLLEIYYAARNGDAFEAEAQELHGLIEDHGDPAWQKIVEMGRDLRPESPLFDDTQAAEAAEPSAEAELGLADNEFEFQEDEQIVARSSGDNSIDFDLGELEEFGATRAVAAQSPRTVAESSADVTAGDMALEMSSLAGSMEMESEVATASADSQVAEFDLSDLDLEPGAAEALLADMEPETEDEQDLVDGGVLADGDEVGTKLDLARAYIDMGDPDGARSILDEVLEEGDEEQKNEAEGLMAQIS